MSEPVMKRSITPQPITLTRIPKGYRVHSAKEASKYYDVTAEEDRIVCTCPDFIKHKREADYQCKHIVAALEAFKDEQNQESEEDSENGATDTQESSQEMVGTPKGNSAPAESNAPQMRIKRSLSPDGRINCISITIDFSLAGQSSESIKAKAVYALKLQHEIVSDYLIEHAEALPPTTTTPPEPQMVPFQMPQSQPVGHPAPVATIVPLSQPSSPIPARLTSIGAMNGKWGLRYFITVDLGGKLAKLFGSQKQLAEHIQSAGYSIPADQIREGVSLNIPCRVTTQPSADGKYLNIERVFPAQ